MKTIVLCCSILVACSLSALRAQPRLSPEDRARIKEVFRLAESVQDSLWPGWSKAPFAIVLVRPDFEFLIRHPHATNNFDTLGYDQEFQSLVLYRKRLFAENLFATFPAVNGYMTIVSGQLQNTNAGNSTAWVVTLLHEHFHQLQMSQPNYFADTEALGLSRGDKSGMWMLNYPFPYDSALVNSKFSDLCNKLAGALSAPDAQIRTKLSSYLDARKAFQLVLLPADYKYFSFQEWQEGVARYSEWRVAKFAAGHFTPSPEFQSLKDFKPFAQIADSLESRIVTGLPLLSLAKSKRNVFYTVGAAEAMLLDRIDPRWQKQYFEKKFFLDAYYP
jgi:hypothetical protein